MSNEYSIKDIISLFLSKLWMIIIVGVIGGAAAFVYTKYFMPLQYSSHISMYIQSYTTFTDDPEQKYNNINYSKQLINTYIEVLKDAASTAVYGTAGANGVLLINTKHGKIGKTHVNVKGEYSWNTRTKTPEFVDGLTYAKMKNEAFATRSKQVPYSASDLYLLEHQLGNEDCIRIACATPGQVAPILFVPARQFQRAGCVKSFIRIDSH